MEILVQDLRYCLRTLRRNPGFAAIAVLALTLGIGANTAIFSVVDAVLLRPLPYPEPGRLVAIAEVPPDGSGRWEASYPNFRDWEREARSFEAMGAWATGGTTLTGVAEPAQLVEARVSPDLLGMLGGSPSVGRGFRPEEERPGGEPVVLVSHGFWQRRLGGDPDVIGRTVTLDAEGRTIIGVLPRSFRFPADGVELWSPLGGLADRDYMQDRDVHILHVLGRLRPETTLERAQEELAAVVAGIQERFPGEDDGHGVSALPLLDELVGEARPALLLLLGAVALVLLIACANVANLLLARGAARGREMAVRTMLGASRARTVRQLLTESLLLGLIGGACSLLLAVWGVDLLAARLGDLLPRADGIGMDVRVLGFTLAASLLTGLLFGVIPAFQAWRGDLNQAFQERGGATTAGPSRRGLRHALIVAEVALSLVLLVGTGLLVRSLWKVLQQPAGFQADRLLLMTVSLPAAEFPDREQVVSFYRALPERLESLPGVRTVSAVNLPPISGGDSNGVLTISNRPFPPGEAPGASFRRVLPNYFRTMGIPLIRGREFDERDDGTRDVVLINETMARRYFAGEDPVGRRIKVGPAEREPWLTIVGVVGDVRNVGLEHEPALATYEPHAQRPWRTMRLAIRTRSAPGPLGPRLRRALRRLEPGLLVSDVSTMEERIHASLAPRWLSLSLLALFASVAVLLTCVGIYGVTAQAVAQRTREIGVRVALGARRRDLLVMVVGQGLRLAGIGAALGLAAAAALTRLMSSLLYGVGATDPGTFVAIPLLLLAVAALASYVPARRAARLDPMAALRYE